MQRKTAADFPPDVLKLFDGYVHGRISRRDFLDRAAKFAVGGVTAAAMLESLRPNYAWAVQVPKDDGRIHAEYVTYPSPRGPTAPLTTTCADRPAHASRRNATDSRFTSASCSAV